MGPKHNILQLPLTVVTRIDASRLLREAESVDEFLMQAAIRKPGTNVNLPKSSRLMDEMLNLNKLNLLVKTDRRRLIDMLVVLHKEAPVLHISFGADPSPFFLQKLITWLRSEIHPLVLLKIGLQPTIGAGCTIRAQNKFFDFSLRENIKKHKPMLVREIEGLIE
ncbi:MAG TPA: hypothetical protein VLF39_02305 [Candidatus Saccharimonadales bacterium]|nr:hypothetical protein [Candidatus Saccharimonadales bacterium]